MQNFLLFSFNDRQGLPWRYSYPSLHTGVPTIIVSNAFLQLGFTIHGMKQEGYFYAFHLTVSFSSPLMTCRDYGGGILILYLHRKRI